MAFSVKCFESLKKIEGRFMSAVTITYSESTFEEDLLIASMKRRNDYSEENLFQCFNIE